MSKTLLILFLAGGIFSSLIFLFSDLISSFFLYPDYDITSMQVSELSAIGAPSRPFWLFLGNFYFIVQSLFGVGVILSSKNLSLTITGILIILFALVGHFMPPMHQRGTADIGTPTDTFHLIFVAAEIIIMILFMILGSLTFSKNFKIYSYLSIIAMMICGIIVGTQVPAIAAGLPTPWMGLVERVSVYSPLLWNSIFSIKLSKFLVK